MEEELTQPKLWSTQADFQIEPKTILPNLVIQPTASQIEKLRLILSTYQDGSGQNGGGIAPGWRDFERAVAVAFDGQAQESKHVFDVIVRPGDGEDA